jgi:hypothetical protein
MTGPPAATRAGQFTYGEANSSDQPFMARGRRQVGPNGASWPVHSCGSAAIKGLSRPDLWADTASILTLVQPAVLFASTCDR